jgi:hypothetical protein
MSYHFSGEFRNTSDKRRITRRENTATRSGKNSAKRRRLYPADNFSTNAQRKAEV